MSSSNLFFFFTLQLSSFSSFCDFAITEKCSLVKYIQMQPVKNRFKRATSLTTYTILYFYFNPCLASVSPRIARLISVTLSSFFFFFLLCKSPYQMSSHNELLEDDWRMTGGWSVPCFDSTAQVQCNRGSLHNCVLFSSWINAMFSSHWKVICP